METDVEKLVNSGEDQELVNPEPRFYPTAYNPQWRLL